MKEFKIKKLAVSLVILIVISLVLLMVNFFNGGSFYSDANWQKAPSDYDVIVLGGEPEGISAAIAAAKAGGKVLLLSYEDGLGGLMTYGMLNSIDIKRNSKKEMVTKGIFSEFYDAIGGDSFDVNQAKKVFNTMVKRQKNISYIPKAKFISPILDSNIIKGVRIEKSGIQKDFHAKIVIDATPDADVVTKAGAPYTVGQEDVGLKNTFMCSTLVFKVKGVDWSKLAQEIKKQMKGKKVKDEGINTNSAWGFGAITKQYKPIHENMKLRGLNIGKQEDGSILINALQIFDIDLFDENAKKAAIAEGGKEAQNIVAFLKTKIPAFSNAVFAGTAESLYIRETRHVEGEYKLKASDVLNNRNFDDKIALGTYPIDMQAVSVEDVGNVIGTPDQYSIPLRCLVPLKVENAFVVGRSASYTSVAAGSARVIPIGMATGQAAGVAAVYSIKNNISPRRAANGKTFVAAIQQTLRKQGAYLENFSIPNKNATNWVYQDIEKLGTIGVVGGGYDNNYRFKQPILTKNFVRMVSRAVDRMVPGYISEDTEETLNKKFPNEYVTKDIAAQILLYISDKKDYSRDEAWNIAKNKALLSKDFIVRVKNNNPVLREEAFNLCAYFIEKLSGKKIEI